MPFSRQYDRLSLCIYAAFRRCEPNRTVTEHQIFLPGLRPVVGRYSFDVDDFPIFWLLAPRPGLANSCHSPTSAPSGSIITIVRLKDIVQPSSRTKVDLDVVHHHSCATIYPWLLKSTKFRTRIQLCDSFTELNTAGVGSNLSISWAAGYDK